MNRRCALFICLIIVLQAAQTLSAESDSSIPLRSGQMTEDLAYLREVWANTDRSFAPAARARFDAFVSDLAGRTNELTPAQFELEVSRALAMARNGHTASSLWRYVHFLPIKLWWFADGLYVVRAQPDLRSLVGAQVESIGPFSPEQLLSKVAPYISGSDLRIRALSPSYMRCLELLQTVAAASADGTADLRVRLRSGREEIIRLGRESAPDPDPFHAYFGVLLRAPRNLAGRWPEVLDGIDRLPEAFQRPAHLASAWMGPQRDVLYIRSNAIAGGQNGRYDVFQRLVEMLHEDVAPKRPRFAVIDLRWNDGGDLFNTIVFAQALPRLIPGNGRIYVLVSSATFSAAIVTAAMLKAEGGDKVVISGEPVGDSATFWAEGLPMTLPNSKIAVRPATWMENWEEGCSDRSRCYWANTVFARSRVSLEPQLRFPFTFADYASGRDALLSAVVAAAH